MADKKYYAHTKTNPDGTPAPQSAWQPLDEHLRNVAKLAAGFAECFGSSAWAHNAGLSEAQAEEFRAAVCAGFDAAVFLGGDTPVAPGLYGGASAEEKYPPIKERDESEIRFYRGYRLRGAGKSFAICRGAQNTHG